MSKLTASSTRREFLKCATGTTAAALVAGQVAPAAGFETPIARPRVAVVGTGSRWSHRATGLDSDYGTGKVFAKYGDVLAICDADAERRDGARAVVKSWSGKTPDAVADYRAILDRDDIDIVHVSTPDHWHAKIAIEAVRSGKDVYCEKPMTLTIGEGMLMCEACQQTKRIVQVGTQQRSNRNFLTALAMVREGRLGTIRRAVCSIGGAPTSPQLPVVAPPTSLDWDLWLGPAPKVPYRRLAGPNGETKSWSRSHYEFRWWYEYSGGKLTDWGAHHVDCATWLMGKTETGPESIEPVHVKHPVPFENGYPTDDSQYNTATEFLIETRFADGTELVVRHDQGNGVLLEGTEGRIFVNRGRLTGRPVEQLQERPLTRDVTMGRDLSGNPDEAHVRNFFESATSRQTPISDVFSHHRALSTCHLAGIAARVGRKIRWDPQRQQTVGDELAQALVARAPRRGYEIEGPK